LAINWAVVGTRHEYFREAEIREASALEYVKSRTQEQKAEKTSSVIEVHNKRFRVVFFSYN